MFDFEIFKKTLLEKFPQHTHEISLKNPSLDIIEKKIKALDPIKDISQINFLLKIYTANIFVSATEYKAAMGGRFKVIKYDDFISECLREKYLFTEKGYYRGVNTGDVICVELSTNFRVDLCFGSYKEVKDKITSYYYILFKRNDISDFKLLQILQHLRKMKFEERKLNFKKLVDKNIILRRSDDRQAN